MKWICIFILLVSSFCLAEELAPPEEKAIDLVVVLDSSRSMQRTDPEKLRNQGAKMLYQLLGEDDRIALISFDVVATVESGFSYINKESSEEFESLIDNTPDEGGFTDLKAGLEAALRSVNSYSRPHAETAVLLLSDGQMDPHPDIASPRQQTINVFRNLFPAYKRLGVSVHTVALSEQADKELLASFSRETGGLHFYAPTPEELSKAFTDLFLSVAEPQLLQLNSESFLIDDSVSEATFLINKVSEASVVVIKDPLGTELTANSAPGNYSWYMSKTFDIITIKNPLRGNWQVLGIRPGSGFASVVTDLRLVVEGPTGPTEVGVEKRIFVRAKMFEGSKAIGKQDLSGAISSIGYRLYDTRNKTLVDSGSLNDLGINGDELATDKEFSASIPVEKTGEYELVVSAIAPTFTREKRLSFTAYDQKIELSEDISSGNYEVLVTDETVAITGAMSLVASGTQSQTVTFPVSAIEKTETKDTKMIFKEVVLPSGDWDIYAEWKGMDDYGAEQTIHSNTIKSRRAVAVAAPGAEAATVDASGLLPILGLLISLLTSGATVFLGISASAPELDDGAVAGSLLPNGTADSVAAVGSKVSGSERQLSDEEFAYFKIAVTENPASAEAPAPAPVDAAEAEVEEEDAQAILDAFEEGSEDTENVVVEEPEPEEEPIIEEVDEPEPAAVEEAAAPQGPDEDEVAEMLAALGQTVDQINSKEE